MELTPVRHPRRHVLRAPVVVGALLGAWLLAAVVAPNVLGLRSDVLHDVEGVRPGTVAMSRAVPVGDVRAGDRVSLDGHLHRVLSVAPGVLVADDLTRGGAPVEVLAGERPSVDVVTMAVPYLGLPIVGLTAVDEHGRWLSWLVLMGLLVLAARRRRLETAIRPPPGVVASGVSIG